MVRRNGDKKCAMTMEMEIQTEAEDETERIWRCLPGLVNPEAEALRAMDNINHCISVESVLTCI
jgi:hypothetical protein